MKKYLITFIVLFFIMAGLCYYKVNQVTQECNKRVENKQPDTKQLPILTRKDLQDSFEIDGILEETGRMDRSNSPYWWLNSGAFLIQENGIARTLFGKLEEGSEWQIRYKNGQRDIPQESDQGFRPQNLLRLITRSKWQDSEQSAYFKIVKYNLSDAEQRSQSNSLLLFQHYQDGDNLYYAGVRVDGAAVVKKKFKGEYYTMAYQPIFENEQGEYDREINPNLLPIDTWIGLKSEIRNNSDNTLKIKLFIDKDRSGNWELALETIDDGKTYGGEAILNQEYAGIRTDFMDVEFDDYRIKEIE